MTTARYLWRVVVGCCSGGWRLAPATTGGRLEALRRLLEGAR
jgi:hypothetical protein